MYEQMELSRRSQNNETKEADQLHVRWLCNETMTDTYVQVHYSHYFKEVWPWFCSNQHETSICINFVRTDESLTIYNKYPHSVAFFKQWEKSEASNMLTSFLPEWHLSLTISHHHPVWNHCYNCMINLIKLVCNYKLTPPGIGKYQTIPQ